MNEKTLPSEEPRGPRLQLLRPDRPSQLKSLPRNILSSLPRSLHRPRFPGQCPSFLDRLLPLLDEARAAYEQCRARIEAVSQAVAAAEWLEEDDPQPTDTDEDAEPQ